MNRAERREQRRAARLERQAAGASARTTRPRHRTAVLLRLLRFQLKLLFDGVRDLVLSPVSIGVVVIGWLLGREQQYFDALMRLGERTDAWLNLFETRQLQDVRMMNADELLDDAFRVVAGRRAAPPSAPVPVPVPDAPACEPNTPDRSEAGAGSAAEPPARDA